MIRLKNQRFFSLPPSGGDCMGARVSLSHGNKLLVGFWARAKKTTVGVCGVESVEMKIILNFFLFEQYFIFLMTNDFYCNSSALFSLSTINSRRSCAHLSTGGGFGCFLVFGGEISSALAVAVFSSSSPQHHHNHRAVRAPPTFLLFISISIDQP